MVLPQTAINIMPELPISLENQRVLVFAPHCDDEVLGSGGLINRAIKAGSVVRVVIVTDCNKRKIGQKRKEETKKGLSVEGLGAQNIAFLNFPEGESSPKKEADPKMVEAMNNQIKLFNPSIVILPNLNDTHRDHEAVGIAGRQLLHGKNDISILYYLIHYNFLRFPSPPGLRPDDYLLPPARLINLHDNWFKFSLTSDEVDQKEDATSQYKSQLSLKNPILVRVLWDFVRQNELFMMEAESGQHN